MGHEIPKLNVKSMHHKISVDVSPLTVFEKVYYHTAVADMNVRHKNMKTARKEYWRVFLLNPFSIRNNVNIVLSYLGRSAWALGHRVYEIFKNH